MLLIGSLLGALWFAVFVAAHVAIFASAVSWSAIGGRSSPGGTLRRLFDANGRPARRVCGPFSRWSAETSVATRMPSATRRAALG